MTEQRPEPVQPEPGPPIPGQTPPLVAPSPAAPTYAWEAPPPPQAAGPGVAGLEFAGVAVRLVAWLIDGLLVGLITIPILVVFPQDDVGAVLYTVAFVAVDGLYHVIPWTSSWRATLAQRLLKLQVGEASTGRTLTTTEATRRWVALGSPLLLFGIVPSLAPIGSGLWLILAVLLLISTGSSPTRQGIHDRFAGSAVVQPAGKGTSAAVLGCLIILLILVLLPLLSIVALIFLGGQLSDILSDIGRSI